MFVAIFKNLYHLNSWIYEADARTVVKYFSKVLTNTNSPSS